MVWSVGMAVKLVALMRMARGVTREQFRDHYEMIHVPLVREMMPEITEYRRNYFPQTTGGFDVLTEIHFASQADFDTAMASAMTGKAKERREADEAFLFDVSAHVISVVEVCE
jgi:uncharacterized protein (TIGR02118 family)